MVVFATGGNSYELISSIGPAGGHDRCTMERSRQVRQYGLGWIIMSIGMAIGAGIVFLPVQVGLVGVWVYLFSAIIAYPAIYLLQRLFINTLADSPRCERLSSVISGY